MAFELDLGEGSAVLGDGGLAVFIFGVLGALTALCWCWACTCCCWQKCCRPERNLRKKYKGDWAAVTGATDGIGKGFALELAKRGFNVMLISRTPAKLDAVAAEIKAAYPKVQTRTVQATFGGAEVALYERLEKELASVNLGILVNNVGTGPAMHDCIDLDAPGQPTWNDYQHMLNMNMATLTRLSIAAARQMVRQGGKGGIVNISSTAGYALFPKMAAYGATKSYVAHLSGALYAEVETKGIDVTCIAMGGVSTPLLSKFETKKMKAMMGPFIIQPRTAASGSLAALSHGEQWATPHWRHALMQWNATLLSGWPGCARAAARKQMAMMSDGGKPSGRVSPRGAGAGAGDGSLLA